LNKEKQRINKRKKRKELNLKTITDIATDI